MAIDTKHVTLPIGRSLVPAVASAVLARARSLYLAAQDGRIARPLKGRNIGLLSSSQQSSEALLFSQAATALGANVAHVRANLSESSSPLEIAEMARLLGRLYDAVECQGLSAEVVMLVTREAGIPVLDGIGCANHPTAVLAARLDPTLSDDTRRRLVIQALLLEATS